MLKLYKGPTDIAGQEQTGTEEKIGSSFYKPRRILPSDWTCTVNGAKMLHIA